MKQSKAMSAKKKRRHDSSDSSVSSHCDRFRPMKPHITWNNRTSKKGQLNKSAKIAAKEFIDNWKSCPDSVEGNRNTGTMYGRDKDQFRIDLQAPPFNNPPGSEQKFADIQMQLNKSRDLSKQPHTSISTLILACDEPIGAYFIKEALKIGLDEDKGTVYLHLAINRGQRVDEATMPKHAKGKGGKPAEQMKTLQETP